MSTEVMAFLVIGSIGVVGWVVRALLKRDFERILAAVDRVPSREWFIEAGNSFKATAEHTMAIDSIKESLDRGRERMDRTDEKVMTLGEKVAGIAVRLNGAGKA